MNIHCHERTASVEHALGQYHSRRWKTFRSKTGYGLQYRASFSCGLTVALRVRQGLQPFFCVFFFFFFFFGFFARSVQQVSLRRNTVRILKMQLQVLKTLYRTGVTSCNCTDNPVPRSSPVKLPNPFVFFCTSGEECIHVGFLCAMLQTCLADGKPDQKQRYSTVGQKLRYIMDEL